MLPTQPRRRPATTPTSSGGGRQSVCRGDRCRPPIMRRDNVAEQQCPASQVVVATRRREKSIMSRPPPNFSSERKHREPPPPDGRTDALGISVPSEATASRRSGGVSEGHPSALATRSIAVGAAGALSRRRNSPLRPN